MKKLITILFLIPLTLFAQQKKDIVHETGTIITTVFTPKKIYLFSDGRTTKFGTDSIMSNTRNKIFKISKSCALLTAGIKIPGIDSSVILLCKKNNSIYADEIVKQVHDYLTEYWKRFSFYNQGTEYLKNVRIFVFVCGYDSLNNQREYFLDNMSDIPFTIQEHQISYLNQNIVYSTMGGDNSTALLSNYLTQNTKNNNSKLSIDWIIRKSFDEVKDKISQTDIGIGGRTFEVIITKDNYFEIK